MNTTETINDELNIYDCDAWSGDIQQIAAFSMDQLNSIGHVILRNFDVDVDDVAGAGETFTAFTRMMGEPIGHDAEGRIVWDIKTNPDSKSQIKTYSEHSSEAEMHTDSQYSDRPEEYFGLLTLEKAKCGGGESMLLSLADILTELREVDPSGEYEAILRNTKFPFIVPNVFRKQGVGKHEFNFGPILRDNEIRFRIDTLEKALIAEPDLCDAKQMEAYQALKEIVLNSPSIQTFYLESRDLILINNRTVLHGRREFSDNDRHLLRIRFNS